MKVSLGLYSTEFIDMQSTGIGKTMARLRKSGPEELRTQADELVKKWKKSVNPAPTPAQPSATEATKRPR